MLRRRKPRLDEPPVTAGVGSDTPWEMLAEELSAPSEKRYQTLVERLPTVIYERDRGEHGNWNYVGPRIHQLSGHREEEWVEDPTLWASLVHPDDRERVLAAQRGAAADQILALEYRILHRSGYTVWVRDEAELIDEIGRSPYWRGTLSDVTALNEIAERHQELIEHLPAVSYQSEAGPDGRWLYVSPQIERLLGYTAEQWKGNPTMWEERLHPEDRDKVVAKDEAASRQGPGYPDEDVWEYRLLHRDGHVVWVRDQGRLYDNPLEGRPPLWRGVLLDVTAEREAEHGLEGILERYRSLVELIPAVVYHAVREGEPGTWDYVSPQVQDLLGYSPRDWIQNPALWSRLLHPDDRELVLRRKQEAWNAAPGERMTLEYRLLHRDGHAVRVRDEAVLNLSDAGPALDGLLFDVAAGREAAP